MYEIFNPYNGKTLGWSRTMMGAWRKAKALGQKGIPADFIQSPVGPTSRKALGWLDA